MIKPISNQHQNKMQTSFKSRIIPTKAQADYFYKEYPLLGKFIPQHCFGFLKYDGTEFTRYMITTGCAPCSKLTLYDKVQQMAFMSHVDVSSMFLREANRIKAELFKRGMKPERLIGTDTPGLLSPLEDKLRTIKQFFEQIGLKPENIHQPQNGSLKFDGAAIDLVDGEIYDVSTMDYLDFNQHKNGLLERINKLKNQPELYAKAMKEFYLKNNNPSKGLIDYLEI